MITTRIEKRDVVVIDDIRCNQCGKSCAVETGDGGKDFCGLHEIEVSGGYYSPTLPDTVTFVYSLCEPCLGRLFSTFVIQPERLGALFAENGKWVDGKYVWDGEKVGSDE